MELIRKKIQQAHQILEELNIDVWVLFCRESTAMHDPSLDLLVGHDVIWTTAFFYTQNRKTIALVGIADAPDYERSVLYDEVIIYGENIGVEFRRIIEKIAPQQIALNFSKSNVTGDGLTYGMYLVLKDYLENSPYGERFISAEEIIARLRGRKNDQEIDYICQAAVMAAVCWDKSVKQITPGMSEIQIAKLLKDQIVNSGGTISFDPVVNAGSKTKPGHGSPTEARLEPGEVLHVDFGAKVNGYCSDIQRVAYFKKEGEETVPQTVVKAFDKIKSIIDVTAKLYKTGELGYKIDEVARKMLIDDGYPEYPHGLGHQIGKEVHDGSSMVGPRWKRYGNSPMVPLETGNTFTVELGIEIPGVGYISLEEDLVVKENGGEFLGPRQTELIVK